MIFNAISGSSSRVPVGFLSCPLVGIKCTMLYGNSIHFRGYTELQWRYQEMALAAALYGAVHYVPEALFRESDYSFH